MEEGKDIPNYSLAETKGVDEGTGRRGSPRKSAPHPHPCFAAFPPPWQEATPASVWLVRVDYLPETQLDRGSRALFLGNKYARG